MEVSDEGYNTGEIVGVEGNGAGLAFSKDSVVGAEQEASYLGADFFAVFFQEYIGIFE